MNLIILVRVLQFQWRMGRGSLLPTDLRQVMMNYNSNLLVANHFMGEIPQLIVLYLQMIVIRQIDKVLTIFGHQQIKSFLHLNQIIINQIPFILKRGRLQIRVEIKIYDRQRSHGLGIHLHLQ